MSKKSMVRHHVTELIRVLSLGRVWTRAVHVVQTVFPNSKIFSEGFFKRKFWVRTQMATKAISNAGGKANKNDV